MINMAKEEKKESKEAPKVSVKEVAKEKPKEEPKPAETKPKKPKKPKKKKKIKKVVVARGKRKESVARATIQKGSGAVRINNMLVQAISNNYIRNLILEPIRYAGSAAESISIYVSVSGGGTMGQAQAARTAIAKGLVEYLEDESLKQKFLTTDRSLLVEDSRRVEAKKYKGRKARARFQKSYR